HLPFRDGAFDIISSFNSLDHVENLTPAIAEIVRVLAPSGQFLLLTEIHDRPTRTEPTTFGWNIVDTFGRYLTILDERQYERADPRGMYDSILVGVPWNVYDRANRYGVLSARFAKP
ncbi:MAG: class I SAM-dependent methyltransferase, partial [bacterium]